MALKTEGSSPFTHPISLPYPAFGATTLGCRQVVRHQTLTLASVGSNPAIPAKSEQSPLCSDFYFFYDPLAQQAEQLPFKQWVWSSNLQRVTIAILNKALEKSSFSGVLLSLCICLRGSKNVTKRCFNKPNKKPPKMEKASS